MKSLPKRDWPLLGIALLAFALRMWGLADHSIWWDEGLAAWAARLPVRDIVHWTAHDVHPPLYFLALRAWWLLVGDGEFVLRFPSAWMGTLGVVLVYGLGRSLGGRSVGRWSALCFALSRFAIAWSQEMRMYIGAATLAAGALWATVRIWRSRGANRGAWLAYVLTVSGGLWSLFLMVSLPIITNLAFPLLWLRTGRPRHLLQRWLIAQGAAALLFLPWLAYALPRMPTWSTAEPFSPGSFLHLYTTMLALGVPVNLERYTAWTALVFGILLIGLIRWARLARSALSVATGSMLTLGLALPPIIVYLVSLPIHLYYAPRLAPRYLLPLSVCFYVLLGWSVAGGERRRPWWSVTSGGLVVAAALVGLTSFYPGRARRDDYISLALTLQAHRRVGDGLLLHTDRDWPIFAAHYAGDWQKIPNGAAVDAGTIATYVAPVWAQSDGVWLVRTPDALRIDPQGRVQSWLAERAVFSATWRFGENELQFYARTRERAATGADLRPTFHLPPKMAELPLSRYRTGDTLHLFLYWNLPPTGPVTVRLYDRDGHASQEVIAPPPTPARNGATRQQVDIPLTANIPPGQYTVRVQINADSDPPMEMGAETTVGKVTIVGRITGGESQEAQGTYPLDALLGERIRLLGYDLPQPVVAPGETVTLRLYWQAGEPIQTRYKVFTHLLGETYNARRDNFLWGQQDNEPVGNQAPTTTWIPGETIVDPYAIPVDADAPPGQYQLEVGMYDPLDGTRLPVTIDGVPAGDRILLEVTVEVIGEFTTRHIDR